MLTIALRSKSPEFIHTPGSTWHMFTMAGTHTMQVCIDKAAGKSLSQLRSDAEKLAELLYQPADLSLNIRAALYMPEVAQFTVLTGNQIVIYRGQILATDKGIHVNCGKKQDCYVFGPASGFINAFSLARQKHEDRLAKTIKHVSTRRTA